MSPSKTAAVACVPSLVTLIPNTLTPQNMRRCTPEIWQGAPGLDAVFKTISPELDFMGRG